MQITVRIEWEAAADQGETNEDEKAASELVSEAIAALMDDLRRDLAAEGVRVRVERQ